MVLFCLLALGIGVVAASALDVGPFAIGLAIAMAGGVTAALIVGFPLAATAICTVALLIATQVGYGLGVGLMAAISIVRAGRSDGTHGAPPIGWLRLFRADKP